MEPRLQGYMPAPHPSIDITRFKTISVLVYGPDKWFPTRAGVYSSNGDLLTSESFQCITFTVGNPFTLAVFRHFQKAWIPAVSILFGILAITYDPFLRMKAVMARD